MDQKEKEICLKLYSNFCHTSNLFLTVGFSHTDFVVGGNEELESTDSSLSF